MSESKAAEAEPATWEALAQELAARMRGLETREREANARADRASRNAKTFSEGAGILRDRVGVLTEQCARVAAERDEAREQLAELSRELERVRVAYGRNVGNTGPWEPLVVGDGGGMVVGAEAAPLTVGVIKVDPDAERLVDGIVNGAIPANSGTPLPDTSKVPRVKTVPPPGSAPEVYDRAPVIRDDVGGRP